jgi:hypothetical protein
MFRKRPQLLYAWLSLCMLTLFVQQPSLSQAQSGERCFAETGHCISGAIRAYWEQNGGLPVFGYPISPAREETIEGNWTGLTQWFERDRLEDHSNEGKGVLAGRLGAQYLDVTGRSWRRGPGDSRYPYNPDCRTFFKETGYQICGSFREYWEKNGGLARFGYPITEPMQEQIEGETYIVQYFERRRMEEHPEFFGTPNQVQLGLLGSALRNVYLEQPALNDVPAATQQAILDAAYAHLRTLYPGSKIAVGIIDVTGDQAVTLGMPFGTSGVTVALRKRGATWQVVPAQETPGGDGYAIISLALNQLQDRRGVGVNSYVTRPRLAGDWARVWFVPGLAENLDTVSAFYQRVNNNWRFVTSGSAFPENDLRQLGVPRELWPYGAIVSGPSQ